MLPTTMQAIRVYKIGGPEELMLESVPMPRPGSGEVLVKVQAAGILQTDWKVRKGSLVRPMTFPYVPGSALAGVVAEVGPGVTEFRMGEGVFGRALNGGGSYAEYAVAPITTLARKPEGVTFEEAATFSGGANIAYFTLLEQGKLQAGQRVLIHGGAGSIGSYAVQFAKWRGAEVVATAHTNNVAFVQGLGADKVVDYTSLRFEDVVEKVDLVLDTVGGDTLTRSLEVVKEGGLIISMLQAVPAADELAKRGIRAEGAVVRMAPDVFETVAHLVVRERMTIAIARVFPLGEARAAHAFGEGGHVRGRIVLKMG